VSISADPATAPQRADLARWVIRVGGLVYVAGVVLLALGVYVDLPGFLGAYSDPEAWWPILVQVVAGGAAFITWMRVNRRNNRPVAVVLLGLGILTVLALAIPSYLACPDQQLSEGWSVATRVVGLVTNNYAIDMFQAPTCQVDGVPLALQFARLAQLIVLLVAFTSAVIALLRAQVDRVRVRLSPRLSLVLGAESTSVALLPALATDADRYTLGVVTPDPLAPWVGQARAAGWRVVIADPRRAETLDRLLGRPGRRHALSRLAVLAPDSTESQRLMAAVQSAINGRRAIPGNHPVRALLRMDEAWQAEDWRRRYLSRIPEWIVDTISENEVTARLLVDHMVERGVDQVLLAGQSDLTFAVVAELAQRGREHALDPGRPSMPGVVIVGKSADHVLEEHVLSQRRFGNAQLDRVRAETRLGLDEVVASAVDEYVAPAMAFTGDVSVADQRLAARLGASYAGLLVYSRHTEVVGLGADPLLAQVRAFGSTLDAGQGRPVDSWERIARLVHENYVRMYPDPDDPARRPWNELAPFYRQSNVRQVLTVLGSAVEVGRSWGASGDTATPPSAGQLDEMARREHESWLDHLRRSGWTWSATRDRVAKKHPDLVPWDALSDESREKTRRGVVETLALLETLGYRSFDDPYATWVRFRRRGEVTAVRRNEPWTWTTSDGTVMRGAAGDWEVTDEEGVTRSITPSIFEKTHEPVDGARWRRVGEIRGRKARPGEVVHSLEGDQTARLGQWVLRGVEDEEWLVPTEHLEASYQRLDA
jgi:RyR domain